MPSDPDYWYVHTPWGTVTVKRYHDGDVEITQGSDSVILPSHRLAELTAILTGIERDKPLTQPKLPAYYPTTVKIPEIKNG